MSKGAGTPAASSRPTNEEEVLRRVMEAVRSIDFGSVLIKIHQGKVVGIETSTKLRLKNTQS